MLLPHSVGNNVNHRGLLSRWLETSSLHSEKRRSSTLVKY